MKPYEKPLPGPKQTLSSEKDNDIRDCLTKRDIQGIRYCRNMELVWCALSPVIRCSENEEENIEFWPGIIEDVWTKAEAVQITSPAPDVHDTVQRAPDDAPRPEITWKPQQKRKYHIRFLATECVRTLSDDDVLPYLAYAPPDPQVHKIHLLLSEVLMTPAAEELANTPEKMSPFDPLAADARPGDSSGYSRWKEAVVPYSLALQMASYMAGFWTPTDEWDCKFTINVPSNSEYPPDYVPSINDLLNSYTKGASPETVPKVITQLRYQGLWWGAERIWTEELVRLKLPRSQFAPQGMDVVYPPASPSKSTLEWNKQQGFDADSQRLGSGDKGLFMKIDGLFVVEVDNKEGSGQKVKECRASGMIYELVDQDWEPPNGEGKERVADHSAPAVVPPPQTRRSGASPRSVSTPSTPNRKPRPVLTATYPLPDPPMGYKFNPILAPGHEVVLSLSLISGRYYPHLLTHPRLLKTLQHAAQVPVGGLDKSRHIWAMDGILPGIHQSMDPEYWKPTRGDMVLEADRAAREQFKFAREQIVKQEQETQDHSMQDTFGDPGHSQGVSIADSSISTHV